MIREEIPFAEADRIFAEDINIAHKIIQDQKLQEVYTACIANNSLEQTTVYEDEFQTL